MSDFAKILRILRRRADWTQEELGFEVGVTKAAVSSWENAREVPTFHTLLRLRTVLNVSLDLLVGDCPENEDDLFF